MSDRLPLPGTIGPSPGFQFSMAYGPAQPAGFQEVSGIGMEGITAFREDDMPDNRFRHTLPGQGRQSNITLKRGILPTDHPALSEMQRSLNQPIATHMVTIALLDADGKQLIEWILHEAWLVRCSISPPLRGSGDVAVESLELAYKSISRT